MFRIAAGIAALGLSACSAATSDGSLTLRCQGEDQEGKDFYLHTRIAGDEGSWSGPIELGKPVPIALEDYENFLSVRRNGNEIRGEIKPGSPSVLKIDRSEGTFFLVRYAACEPGCRLEVVIRAIGECKAAPVPAATRKF